MSPLHSWLGASWLKRRCTRSDATGWLCLLSVVTTNLRLYLRSLLTALPQARTVEDYEALLPWCIAEIKT